MIILRRLYDEEVRGFYNVFGIDCPEVEYITVFNEQAARKLMLSGWEIIRDYM